MAFSYSFGPKIPPAAVVRFDDDAKDYPCDIEMALPAYGLADWRADAHVQRTPGSKGTVRLMTLLGVFEGQAYAASVEVDGGGEAVTRLVGGGLLKLVGQP